MGRLTFKRQAVTLKDTIISIILKLFIVTGRGITQSELNHRSTRHSSPTSVRLYRFIRPFHLTTFCEKKREVKS